MVLAGRAGCEGKDKHAGADDLGDGDAVGELCTASRAVPLAVAVAVAVADTNDQNAQPEGAA